jgi:tetratricopeptide (TPR) repeat protein
LFNAGGFSDCTAGHFPVRNISENALPHRWARPAILTVLLLVSLALLAYGAWLLRLERGARAAERGELDAAANMYAAAERWIAPAFASLFPGHYSRSVFPQVGLLFNQGKVDEASGKLEQAATAAPSVIERPEYGFWSGNILLRRAVGGEDPEAIMKNLFAAGEQFRKGLAAAPDDWDLKYNYELVQYMIAQQELDNKKEESKIKSILERMRTVTEPGEKEPPPPEKRG